MNKKKYSGSNLISIAVRYEPTRLLDRNACIICLPSCFDHLLYLKMFSANRSITVVSRHRSHRGRRGNWLRFRIGNPTMTNHPINHLIDRKKYMARAISSSPTTNIPYSRIFSKIISAPCPKTYPIPTIVAAHRTAPIELNMEKRIHVMVVIPIAIGPAIRKPYRNLTVITDMAACRETSRSIRMIWGMREGNRLITRAPKCLPAPKYS